MDNGPVSTEQPRDPAEEPRAEKFSAEKFSTEAPADVLVVPAAVPKRRIGVVAVVALVMLALDVASKAIAASTLEGREPIRVLGGAIYLQLVRNPGAAFGTATGMTWLLALLAIGIVGVMIWLARQLRSVGWAIGLGLVLAGALGNLIDRIFRAPGPLRGHVVDFISLFAPNGEGFAVFNLADSAICVGGALIVLLTLLGRDYDGSVQAKKNSAKSKTEPTGTAE